MKRVTMLSSCALGVLFLAAVAYGAGAGVAELQRIQTLQQKGALGGESDKNQYTLTIRERVKAFMWTTNTITLAQATEFGAQLVGELHDHVAKHMEIMGYNTYITHILHTRKVGCIDENIGIFHKHAQSMDFSILGIPLLCSEYGVRT